MDGVGRMGWLFSIGVFEPGMVNTGLLSRALLRVYSLLRHCVGTWSGSLCF